MRPFIIGGNWKCNGTVAGTVSLATEIVAGLGELGAGRAGERVFVAPTALHLAGVAAAAPSLSLSLQNGPTGPGGALTGQISLAQAAEVKVTYALVGHSERRHVVKEPESTIAARVAEVLRYNGEHADAPITLVLCIGEQLEDREADRTLEVVRGQLAPVEGVSAEQAKHIVLAYEPVWAIGTGKTATPEVAQETHAAIRAHIAKVVSPEVAEAMPIMYGGSVKPASAPALAAQPDIDGFLVGGASLIAKDFCEIVKGSRTE